MPLFSRVLAVVFCFFSLFASIGCEKKLTLDNYNKIQVGMTIDEVFTILGPGEKLDTGTAARVAQSYLYIERIQAIITKHSTTNIHKSVI